MRGGLTNTGYPKRRVSRPKAETTLALLLSGCTPERLAGFTAQGLAASYNVPLPRVEAMLADVRRRRGL